MCRFQVSIYGITLTTIIKFFEAIYHKFKTIILNEVASDAFNRMANKTRHEYNYQ